MSDDQEFEAALDGAIDEVLAAQTPPPAADFWDRIDASLDAVAAERPQTADSAAPTGPLRVADPTVASPSEADPVDTGGDVIRLTDMKNSPTPNRSPMMLRVAAVVVMLAVVGGLAAVALRGGDDDTTTIDVADDGDGDGTTSSLVEETTTTSTPTTSPQEAATTVTTACVAGCEEGLLINPITNGDVLETFGEDVGCWFRVDGADSDEDGFDDTVFFSGDFGAVMKIDGELIAFEPSPEGTSIGLWTVDAYGSDIFRLTFTDVGDEVETSIESTDRPATLNVLADEGGGTVAVPGTLGCGV